MKTVILLGGNLGDSKKLFSKAVELLIESGFILLKKSKIYQSPAWGYDSTHLYLNQVVVFETEKDPISLLRSTLRVERELGRERKEGDRYSDRPIDIDLLYLDEAIINEEELIIPHPRLHLRRFTMAPLAEILPDFIHPILKKDHKSLLLLCTDSNFVEAID